MTKPLHPTADSVKAGQTIYLVSYVTGYIRSEYYVHSISIKGKNYPKPTEGEVVYSAPVDWVKEKMDGPGYLTDLKYMTFYSKRKAVSRMNELQRGERRWDL